MKPAPATSQLVLWFVRRPDSRIGQCAMRRRFEATQPDAEAHRPQLPLMVRGTAADVRSPIPALPHIG